MFKIAKMLQPCGLGDILFLQKFAHVLIENGYSVYWDVISQYKNISNYIIVPNLHFVQYYNDVDLVLDFNNHVEQNHPHDIMTSKYNLITYHYPELTHLHNISWEDWANYLNIKRNLDKEADLYYNILKLKDDEEYIFLNRHMGRGEIRNNIESTIHNKNLKVVEMSTLQGFTLFDWGKVLENATEIHTIDTSINYYIEKLNLKTDILYSHARHPVHTELCLKKLFNKPWIWVSQ